MSNPNLILLAEDEDNDVFFITRAFQKASVLNPIFPVKDGEETLAYLLGEGPFQNRAKHPLPLLVLLDMRMPKISGLEVIARVRQEPGLGHIALVVLTFTHESPDLEKALQAGANGWLKKPVTLDGVVEMLNQIGFGLKIAPREAGVQSPQ
jgi:CheY-like chemotaxis protein